MAGFAEYGDYDGLGLAELVAKRAVHPRELVEAAIARIEAANPRLNAVVTKLYDMARSQADAPVSGPFAGIPFLLKDLGASLASAPTSQGNRRLKAIPRTYDDELVRRYRDAGLIVVGKTNTPEFGAGSQTFNKVFGATHNPYDLTKTCGGSSGGAAVALACGFAPVATGSDTGGSLRNPAAFCNVVGFRPSIGRVPSPKAAFGWSTLSTAGCLGRSVADLALALSSIAGPDSRAPLSIHEGGELFARPLGRSFTGVRVAWFKNLGGVPFDPRVRAVVDGQRATFESLGCIVEQAEPDFAPAEVAFRVLRAWNSANAYGARLREHPDAFKDTLKAEIEEGLRLSGSDVARAETAHTQIWRQFQAFLQTYEYFVLPTTQLPPFSIDTPYPTEIAGVKFDNYIDWMKSCWYISATGNPAASVPAGFTPEGLPVGIQIVGRHKQDFGVLQLAHAFEQATGFGKKRPSIA